MSRALLVTDGAPGPLAGWLADAGLVLVDGTPYDAVVLLGAAHDSVARGAVAASVPVLAVGAGALALVAAAGGRLGDDPAPRPGPGLVRKADAALADPLCASLPFLPDVVRCAAQAVVQPPPGAVVLAAGVADPYAALRLAGGGYALCFELDTTAERLAGWLDAQGWDPAPFLAELAGVDLERTWRPVAAAFAALAG